MITYQSMDRTALLSQYVIVGNLVSIVQTDSLASKADMRTIRYILSWH